MQLRRAARRRGRRQSAQPHPDALRRGERIRRRGRPLQPAQWLPGPARSVPGSQHWHGTCTPAAASNDWEPCWTHAARPSLPVQCSSRFHDCTIARLHSLCGSLRGQVAMLVAHAQSPTAVLRFLQWPQEAFRVFMPCGCIHPLRKEGPQPTGVTSY